MSTPPDTDARGYTPLMQAIERGDVAAARELMSAGADLHVRVPQQVYYQIEAPFCALLLALRKGEGELALELLRAGASAYLPRTKHGRVLGDEGLREAAKHELRELIPLLILLGAAPEPTLPPLRVIPLSLADRFIGGPAEPHLLRAAVNRSDVGLLRCLLERGLSHTPDTAELLLSCFDKPAILRLLCRGGLDANATVGKRGTLLHVALQEGNTQAAIALLQGGADINARGADKETPLMQEVRAGHTELVRALIAGRADVNLPDRKGFTPLMEAVRLRRYELIPLLLAAGAAQNVEVRRGKRQCHSAASLADEQARRMLGISVPKSYGQPYKF